MLTLSDWVVAHNRHNNLTVHDRSDGALSVTVAPTAEPLERVWDIQLLHKLPSLSRGQRYMLTFKAWGTYGAEFFMKLTLPKPPWTWIEQGQLIEISPREKIYKLYFAPSEDLPEVQLQLDLGAADGTLHFSEVRFLSLGPRPQIPETSYMICATPRSGSSWLASLLWNTGAAGRPTESFLHYHTRHTGTLGPETDSDDWDMPRDAYIARVRDLGTTANGVFGTKMMLGYLETTANWLGEPLGLGADQFDQVFENYFPGLRYLHLYRRDKVDQAVSMFIASKTGSWRASNGDGDQAVVEYDVARIKEQYDLLVREDAEWRRRLTGLPGFVGSIAYEDLLENFSTVIADVFARLQLHPTAYPKSNMTSVTRQTSPLKADFSARFKAEMGLPPTAMNEQGKLSNFLGKLRRVTQGINLTDRTKN